MFRHLFLAMVLLLSGCFTTTNLQREMNIPLVQTADSKSLGDITKAIQNACAEREWQCKVQKEGLIRGTLKVRRHTMVVDMKYTKGEISYTYVESENLNYDGMKIHKKYHMWVEALHRSVNKELKGGAH